RNVCSATKPMIAPSCARSWMSGEPSRSFPTAATGNNRVTLTSASTSFVGASKAPSLQAYCNTLRQTGTKLSGLRLPYGCACMVALMSLDPSTTLADFERRGVSHTVFQLFMGGRLFGGPTMGSRTSDWKEELGRFLEPFLDRLGHKSRRQMWSLYAGGRCG